MSLVSTAEAKLEIPTDLSSAEATMRLALAAAEQAGRTGEVPVEAVVVVRGEVVAVAHNQRECQNDPTAHAEIIALRSAAAALGGWRLVDADLYVTMEPCPMCAGAIVHVRLARVVYGAGDPKAGAAGSALNLLQFPTLNHRCAITSGVREAECRELLKAFFVEQRKGNA